jgi:hypothetical protein
VPSFIVYWTQALEADPMHSPSDTLALLAARICAIRAAFRTGDSTDEELMGLATTLERDLLAWSETTLAAGSVCSFHNVTDLDSTHAWNGTRHEYGIPQAFRHWNLWRSLRIVLSRTQEAIWRQSWPILPTAPPNPEQYRAVRKRMTSDICVAVAYAFGTDNSVEPPKGSVSSGYLLMIPLTLAGTCLLEQLTESITAPDGGRMIIVDEPLHFDPANESSTQLAWIIERVTYLGHKIGIGWAMAAKKFLCGERKIYYHLGRS